MMFKKLRMVFAITIVLAMALSMSIFTINAEEDPTFQYHSSSYFTSVGTYSSSGPTIVTPSEIGQHVELYCEAGSTMYRISKTWPSGLISGAIWKEWSSNGTGQYRIKVYINDWCYCDVDETCGYTYSEAYYVYNNMMMCGYSGSGLFFLDVYTGPTTNISW